MLESSLDTLPAAVAPPRSATLRHLIDLCMAPVHIDDTYLRARIEETQWEAICMVLDDLTVEVDEALTLIEEHCSTWQDTHRRAPIHWIERVMRGEHVSLMRVARHVDVRGVAISEQMLDNLCHATAMQHITIMRLDETKLSTWAGNLLADCTTLASLRELYLGYNNIGDEAMAHLCEHGRFDALEIFGLAHTHTGDQALTQLAANTTLHRLQTLQLNQNRITDIGLKALAMSRGLGALQHLHLYLNPGITDEGAIALRARRELAFPELQEIDVYDCNVSDVLSQRMSASYWLMHHDDGLDEASQGAGEAMCGVATH